MNRLTLFRALLATLLAGSIAVLPARSDNDPSHPQAPVASTAHLPDSALLARVDDRLTRVIDFRSRYFSSEAESRPAMDSAGRVQFLSTMIDKDVLGLTAWSVKAPLRFEDRLNLKSFENNVLARTLFTQRLTDSTATSEERMREVYPQFSVELRLRYLLVPDLGTAQVVYTDLSRARLTWKDAARRFSLGPDSLAEGDLGWIRRTEFKDMGAREVYALRPAGLSHVIKGDDGYRIWQCLDRRSVTPPPFVGVRRMIASELAAEHAAPLKEQLYRDAEVRAHAQFDSTNIAWLGALFRRANPPLPVSEGTFSIDLRNRAPEIAPEDTSRVLARVDSVPFTVHSFMSIYSSIPGPTRVKIANPVVLLDVVRRMVLEPTFADMAREAGLGRDPNVVRWTYNREEQLRVERMYDDSISARVQVTERERQDYFQKHRSEFASRDRAVYASLARSNEAGADSVIERIRRGESPRAILAADSASGWRYGSIRSLLRGDPNNYSSILFEELKPGQSTKVGPRQDGSWIVVNLMSFEPSRPMDYAEVVGIVDESVQNITAERLLKDMLARLRRRHKIEQHPERLMQMHLTDPAGDWMTP